MSDIQVILIENDQKLGRSGDVIKVSPGFAMNFLFPHKKAKLATPAELKNLEIQKQRTEKAEGERLRRAEALSKEISRTMFTIEAPAGEGKKLFGAVTAQDIVELLARRGVHLNKKELHLEEPIKALGAYEIPVKLHANVNVTLRLSVMKKSN